MSLFWIKRSELNMNRWIQLLNNLIEINVSLSKHIESGKTIKISENIKVVFPLIFLFMKQTTGYLVKLLYHCTHCMDRYDSFCWFFSTVKSTRLLRQESILSSQSCSNKTGKECRVVSARFKAEFIFRFWQHWASFCCYCPLQTWFRLFYPCWSCWWH